MSKEQNCKNVTENKNEKKQSSEVTDFFQLKEAMEEIENQLK